jgi:hypothetical protein
MPSAAYHARTPSPSRRFRHLPKIKQALRAISRGKKIATILLRKSSSFRKGEPKMRIRSAIFFGSMVAAVLSAPALAKNSDAQKTEESPASPPCHAYQQAPDGSWTPLPCQGTGSTAQTPHKPSARSGTDENSPTKTR